MKECVLKGFKGFLFGLEDFLSPLVNDDPAVSLMKTLALVGGLLMAIYGIHQAWPKIVHFVVTLF